MKDIHAMLREAVNGLEWIAQQPCENAGEYKSCKDLPNNPCASEYCPACYAQAVIDSMFDKATLQK